MLQIIMIGLHRAFIGNSLNALLNKWGATKYIGFWGAKFDKKLPSNASMFLQELGNINIKI
jgi:hypothetical protein